MCGIAGFLDIRAIAERNARSLAGMLDSLTHRGPDDVGTWHHGGISIGHRRLSIVDLSPLGHQPMPSASGRYILAFNGEIYNHKALREQLTAQGWSFRGHSDTEVLLALIEEVGLEQAVIQCVGMFALVLWDTRTRTLKLARDRFGEKPLYYGWHAGQFLFGSELKALTAHPAFQKKVDHSALYQLLRLGYVPAPYCIFQNTFKLPQASILTLRIPDNCDALSEQSCRQTVVPYWSVDEVAIRGIEERFTGSFDDATDKLEAILMEAVGLQMQADVPLGAFLSGGIDSSVIVALMQRQSSRPINTFSIGFDDARFNEAEHAKAVAKHLGTKHTELYVNSRDALDVIPLLPRMYDEPFGDSSQVPTYLVSKLARQHVTVSLSGDGGDEMFYGYSKYSFGQCFAELPFRQSWGRLVGALPWAAIEQAGRVLPSALGRKVQSSRFEYLHALLSAKDNAAIAENIAMIYRRPEDLMAQKPTYPKLFGGSSDNAISQCYQTAAMVLDRKSYLPDDILVKVDRASMAVSLESRAPLLDHRIVEFAARLPVSFLSEGGMSKRILRHVLYRHVPQSLVDRPKAGFSIPLAGWLRGELRNWAIDLLDDSSRQQDEFLNLPECRSLLHSHLAGKRDASSALWPLLMFQAWRREWL
jgi:asparagine synthase (glutamine-hydrolysing)